jgi:hypothetical protein
MPILEPVVQLDDFHVRIDPDGSYTFWMTFEQKREYLKKQAEDILGAAKRHLDGHATLGYKTYYECPVCHSWHETRDFAKWHCQEEENV